MAVLLETTLGDIVIDLFVNERPRCCLNFLKLCKMKYYNLCSFHSIEQNYIAQTGDPTGTGNGGESVFALLYGGQGRFFEPELTPKLRHTRRGLISFVNNGSDMLGSQFFITLADDLDYLDDRHCIFGQVTEGEDTLEKLNEQLCDEANRPFRDIRISHAIILDDPFDDPKQLEFPSRSPSPTLDLLVNSSQIALDEALDEYEGKSAEEIKKEMEAKDMAAQAQILEMVGDLRYAEERPPDNVLFICKLNPVTTDEDLEIIFSRFGKIECCEIIRDRRTGASLQYAFIEFDDPKCCENAYFKMDNVLIDDRRIHVDFSQSVAKNYKWNKKGKADEKDRENEDTKMDAGAKKQKKESKQNRDYEKEKRRRSTSRDNGHGSKRSRKERSPHRMRTEKAENETRPRSRSRDRHSHRHHR